MEATRPAPLADTAQDTAQLAKATLRRLALDKLEPTPENYAVAYAREAGEPAPSNDGAAVAALIGRVVRGLDHVSRGWTSARKKESLHRVLDSSRSDARRLQQRISQLVSSWDGEPASKPVAEEAAEAAGSGAPAANAARLEAGATLPSPDASVELVALLATDQPAAEPPAGPDGSRRAWMPAVSLLGVAVQQALPSRGEVPHELATALVALVDRIRSEGPTAALVDELERLCERAAPVLRHRHHLVDLLEGLCSDLTASLTDLAENDSWARGQCEAMQVRLDEGLTARGVRAVSELLRDTRERHGRLRAEREQARDSLKGLINQMLSELDQLGSQTGHFHDSVGRYADVIEKADSLESLTGVVREMVEESRTVQALVQQTQDRLHQEHSKASDLARRVGELESEMRRLADEVSTDQLTQVANRRGLMQTFEAERARLDRNPGALAIGLLDIDNFKRLNDELGHGAGDEALKALAGIIRTTLRPADHVARYGGEEFVVLLPDTPVDEGQTTLTRLQRALTGGLFMHENKQVFVTFSAGVTAYRAGERIEEALERADQALYEAKRTGKNRTCVG